jgi:transposase
MRISIAKKKLGSYIYIVKDVTINGKRTTKPIDSLGSIRSLSKKLNISEDKVIPWARELAKEMTIKENEQNNTISIKFSQSKLINKNCLNTYNSGYLFLQSVYHELGLNNICKSISDKYKIEYDLNSILSRLIYTRILYPGSKRTSYDSSKKLIEQPDFDIHQIYRSLDVIAKENSFIQSQVYKNSTKAFKRNTSVLYYDCTNYFFEIEKASGLKQYGMSKEHRPNPIVQMGLFMDGDGLPLAFCINPGNQNEQLSLKPLEEDIIKDFKLSKFIVCTDAGLASKSNRIFNNKSNRSYIVTQSLKKIKKYLQEWSLETSGWKLRGNGKEYNISDIDESLSYNSIFYKERWINENEIEQRLIVSYSLKYKNYQQSIRQGQIERAEKMVKKQNNKKAKRPNDPSRFIEEYHTTENGEIADENSLSMNESAILKEAKFDGFYAVCTTLEDDIEDIINVNKRRWEIEESFRIMKTEFKSRPVYLSDDERIKAHFTTCYLALLIERIIEKKLEEKYTTSNIINTLRDMNLHILPGEGYTPGYERTDLTDKLHEIFKFRTDYQITTNKNIKKIIKKSKNK